MRYLVYRSYASDAQSMDQYGLVVNYALHGLQVYMIKYSFDIASIYTCVRGKRRFDSFFFLLPLLGNSDVQHIFIHGN